MSNSNPYINQKDWGQDLLRRLGNFVDEDGSLNFWEEYPVTGKDGSPLGLQHTGYSGILAHNGTTRFIRWNGTSWEDKLLVPFFSDGETIDAATRVNKGPELFSLSVSDEGLSSDRFFITEYGSSSAVSMYSKTSGAEIWRTVVSLESGYAESFLCSVIHTDSDRVYVMIQERGHLTLGVDVGICAIQRSNGYLLWRQSLHKGGSIFGAAKASTGDLFFSSYGLNQISKVDSVNGSLTVLSFFPFGSTLDTRKIFYAPATNTLLFYEQSGTSFRISKRSISDFSASYTSQSFTTSGRTDMITFAEGDDLFVWSYENSKFSLNRYSAGTNAFVHVAELEDMAMFGEVPFLLAAKFAGNKVVYLVTTGNGVRLIELTLGASPQQVVVTQSDFQSEGQGTPPLTATHEFSYNLETNKPEIFLLRHLIKSLGPSSSRRSSLTVWASMGPANRTVFNNAFVTYNNAPVEEDVNSFSIFSEKGAFESVTAKSFFSPGSNPPVASGGIREEWPGRGVFVGNQGVQVFESYGHGVTSKGYTGGGAYVGGISFYSSLVNSVLHSRYDQLRSGIFCYDWGLNKFFLECRIPSFPDEAEITNFPNGSGLVLASNMLGVGTQSPSYPVDVNGTLRATTVMNSGGVVSSDPRIKTGIIPLNGIELWDVCKELTAISFLYRPNVSSEVNEVSRDVEGNVSTSKVVQPWNLPATIQYGYNAKEVQDLFPELVTTDPQSGFLYLNREALFPIFQSAATTKINQLEEVIAQKDTLLTQLQSALESLTARVEALENAAT